ncbi:hypothetical protein F5X97DRAFT_320178 [Nemania serpens]|nr:hypothetical protein F5X97DRAFT_320178 [Nemania serpens]
MASTFTGHCHASIALACHPQTLCLRTDAVESGFDAEWNELLLKTRFSGSEIELNDFKHPICYAYSVKISTKLPPTPKATPAKASLVILHGSDQAKQDQADGVKSGAEAKGLSARLASL